MYYRCDMLPCRAWRPEGKKCYICNKNCDNFRGLAEPSPRDLLENLTCDPDCEKIVVTSSGPAAVWQNKRTGLFRSDWSSLIGREQSRYCPLIGWSHKDRAEGTKLQGVSKKKGYIASKLLLEASC